MVEKSCPIQPLEKSDVEIVILHPDEKVADYQEAMALAKAVAIKRFEDYMLMSWYDRDRDFESPPNTTEWTAPIRAQASIATAASGIIGIYKVTRSPRLVPNFLSTLAIRHTR